MHARPNRVEIDLGAIANCVRDIRAMVGPEVTVFGALKCNAYGFGLVPVGKAVLAAGANALSVVDRADAVALRQAGITMPILLYAGNLIDAASVAAAEKFDLITTLIDRESVEMFARHAARPLKVAVKFDVGQERLGVVPEEAVDFMKALSRIPNLNLHVVNAHPYVAPNRGTAALDWQFERFVAACTAVEAAGITIPVKLFASSKALGMVKTRMVLNAVDPGQLLFGAQRKSGDPPAPEDLQPLRALKSRLIHARLVTRSDFLEDAPFPVRPGMRLGVLPIGSSDGVEKLHCGEVLVQGKRARILGAASLEYMRIDLTEVPEARVGDEVVIIGRQGETRIGPEAVLAHQKLNRVTDLAMAVRSTIPRQYLNPGCAF